MKCHVCGGKLEKTVTDLPFKVRHNSIVIVKCLPILQCDNCQEYLIEDEGDGNFGEDVEKEWVRRRTGNHPVRGLTFY